MEAGLTDHARSIAEMVGFAKFKLTHDPDFRSLVLR